MQCFLQYRVKRTEKQALICKPFCALLTTLPQDTILVSEKMSKMKEYRMERPSGRAEEVQRESVTQFDIGIAQIVVCFSAPFAMEVAPELRPFLTQGGTPQEHYRFTAAHEVPCGDAPPIARLPSISVYRAEGGQLRVFHNLRAPDGNCAAVLLRENGMHTVYLPESDLARYTSNCTMAPLLCGEYLFYRHAAMLLHSSLVSWAGEAILFCGASGAGKSTQAELWRRYRNADVLNGDRCLIRRREARFWGYGSPFCGSSGIYRPEGAPIRAVFFPEKAETLSVTPLSPVQALRRLYPQLTVNTWDTAFLQRITDLLSRFAMEVPAFCLRCRPDEAAVQAAQEAMEKI